MKCVTISAFKKESTKKRKSKGNHLFYRLSLAFHLFICLCYISNQSSLLRLFISFSINNLNSWTVNATVDGAAANVKKKRGAPGEGEVAGVGGS